MLDLKFNLTQTICLEKHIGKAYNNIHISNVFVSSPKTI